MQVYLCLDPSVQQEEWTTIRARSSKEAAEVYAHKMHTDSSGETDATIPVWVKDPAGAETRWEVTREWEPTFSASPET